MTGDTDETDAADDPADGPPADDPVDGPPADDAGDAFAAEAPVDGPSTTDATGSSDDAVETGDRTDPDAADASGGTDGSDGTGGSGGADGPDGPSDAGGSGGDDGDGGGDGGDGGDDGDGGSDGGGGDDGSGGPGGSGGGGDDPYRRDVDPERVEYLAAELADLQEDVEGLESRVTDKTVHRDDIEAELRRYVRARQRRGHATGWGPYLVLLYGVFMTLGAFYYLGGPWAIIAMIIVWLSTLGLYVVMAVLSTGISVTRRVAALRNVVRRFR